MRILHLSDLHRGGSETLKAIWGGPQSAIRKLPEAEQRFDYIVVSGDLSETARPGEYDELLEFTLTTLTPYLREPEDRRRLIFVPGNHDVDWSADLGEPLQIAAMLEGFGGANTLEKHLRAYREDPARSGIRQIISKYGHVEWLRLDEDRQANRFRNVQRFLDELYGDGLAAPCRRFDLLSPREGHDWSAHIFPEEQVAFVGFNSCFMNDRYWTGAAISRESIAQATTYLHEHADGCLRIAVWHHGVHTDSYRPDYLNQADIGELIISGFQVGFHGHTHKASSEQLDWLTDRFVIVSTGSLGANQHHRPDAVGRQFSIARLYPHQAYVQVYERGGDVSAYVRKRTRTFSLVSPTEKDHREVTANLHRRAYHVDRHGIMTVDVEITELQSPHPVVVAEVTPPVCEARGAEAPASSPGFEIRQTHHPREGTIRFTLYPPEYRPTDLRWRYQASNAIPLTRAEVPLYDVGLRRGHDPARSGDVLRTHLVTFPCKLLDLAFDFEGDVIEPGSAAARVERLVQGPGEAYWERAVAEERRCRLAPEGERAVRLEIEAPIVGHRYGVAFRPSAVGAPLDYMSSRIAAKLIDRCLGDRDSGPMLACLLAESVVGAVSGVFNNMSLDRVTWSGLIWDDARKRLSTVFGNFPQRQWAVTFAHGAGIAGHAFRFNRPGAWCRGGDHSKEALVYQRRASSQDWEPDHDWIVCVPIVGDGRKNPLGVVCFEGGGKAEGFGDRLREFANAALAREVTKGSPWEAFQHNLSTAVNTGFWQACAVAECLVDYQSYVDDLIRGLGLGGVPGEPAS
ncbi:MAG: metallophosphoesterase [Myxococcales bacterium]|nr:metallophosphoesterase [Myxococcales bacterium]MCB9704383.1 metallophosphoesterase [Myxococcales bacterium]